MKTYTAQIQWDDEYEEYVIPLPDEILQETGWGYKDQLEWTDNKDGTFTLRRII